MDWQINLDGFFLYLKQAVMKLWLHRELTSIALASHLKVFTFCRFTMIFLVAASLELPVKQFKTCEI
jgi:hypothetical protein